MKKKRLTLQEKAFIALKKAVRETIKQHQKMNRPIAIWQKDKVVRVPANRFLSNNGK